MSKQILEQIKALPQNERIELFKQFAELNAYDTNHASQGIDNGTGYWDDYLKKTYDTPKTADHNPNLHHAAATVKDEQGNVVYDAGKSEKEKTGEVLPGPITEEDKKTGEADKIAKEQ